MMKPTHLPLLQTVTVMILNSQMYKLQIQHPLAAPQRVSFRLTGDESIGLILSTRLWVCFF